MNIPKGQTRHRDKPDIDKKSMNIPKGQTRHRQEKYEHTEGRIRSCKSKKDNIGHKTQTTQRRKLKQ